MKHSINLRRIISTVFMTILFLSAFQIVRAQTLNWNQFKTKAGEVLKKIPADADVKSSALTAKSKADLLKIKQKLQEIVNQGSVPSDANQKKYATEINTFAGKIKNGIIYKDDDTQSQVPACESRYNDCKKELSCDDSGLICLCCVPCSLELIGCLGDLVREGKNNNKPKVLKPNTN